MAPEQVVVVVEDDPSIADLVDTYLRRDGFRVYLAPDAGSASVPSAPALSARPPH